MQRTKRIMLESWPDLGTLQVTELINSRCHDDDDHDDNLHGQVCIDCCISDRYGNCRPCRAEYLLCQDHQQNFCCWSLYCYNLRGLQVRECRISHAYRRGVKVGFKNY